MSENGNSMEKILSEINFKLGKKLGEGMFSTVKIATHSLTKEQVAIKILEKTRISKIEDKERINREIAVLKKVNHFNIIKLYAVIETKIIIYLIQEYIEGKEFMEYLNKKGKLSETDACKYFHQIISGLEYLHQCGIAHRDFKPENILLTNNNQVIKIIDFGLSNIYKKGELLKTACGSPCYAPPEMIKEENYNGALTDIWSSGIILYLMLCGKLPFYDDDNQILYDKILAGKYEVPKHLSKDAKDILSKILEVDPKKRINFESIKSHPWFSLIDINYLMHTGINTNIDIIPIDEEIIKKMENLGLKDKVEIRYNIIKNYHNKITTIYNLLLKQKIERGKKSISDMNSDIYDEYINDKKNKIEFYGSIEKVLKNRIGDDDTNLKNIPNWPENKYDDNDENIIQGYSGSVMERLIKAGKFSYDEENMCLNRVVNSRLSNTKDENNFDESKFKTISSFKTNKENKKNFRKINITEGNEEIKTKKAKVRFQEKDKSKEINNSTKTKEKIENKKNDDKDWFREVEELIDMEIEQKNQNKKNLKYKSSLSSRNLKPKSNKKVATKLSNNNQEDKKQINKYKSSTTLKRDSKKSKGNSGGNSEYQKSKSSRAMKTVKIIKNTDNKRRENSLDKNNSKKSKKFKKINIEEENDIGRKRNNSVQKRKVKMKI